MQFSHMKEFGKENNKMIAITGITGHSGHYFYQELIKYNYNDTIKFLVRSESDTSFIENKPNFHVIITDLNNIEALSSVFSEVDTIIHIAGIHYTPFIVEAALRGRCRRLIAVHTTGRYSKHKHAAFEYIRIDDSLLKYRDKIKITILRPTMIYGDLCDHNMSKFIKMVDKFKVYPNIAYGTCLIQPVHAEDLGKAYYQVMTSAITEGKDYILSGEKPIQLIECLKIIQQELGSHTIFVPIPLSFAVAGAKCLKLITLGKIDIIEKVLRMGEDRSFDHQAATDDFDFKPRSFNEGIHYEINQYKGVKE